MACITVLTIGSRGDIQLFFALALGLIAKGHSVALAGSVNFADFAAQLGVPFVPIAGDFQQLLQTSAGLALLQGKINVTVIIEVRRLVQSVYLLSNRLVKLLSWQKSRSTGLGKMS